VKVAKMNSEIPLPRDGDFKEKLAYYRGMRKEDEP
jgi:hypothetical protein